MELFHGSNKEIRKPDLNRSRSNVDFGRGFYTTTIYSQAEKWCGKFLKRGEKGVVSEFCLNDVDLQTLKVLSFCDYSDEWLEFVLSCRKGNDKTDYDVVIGGVANDKVFDTVELYFDGLIDKQTALGRLRFEQPNLQVCFRTQRALDKLSFTGSKTL